jgi:hypothetical protein
MCVWQNQQVCNFGETGKILKERLYNIERHTTVAKNAGK